MLAITTTVMAASTAVASAVPATFTPSSGSFNWKLATPLVVTWPTGQTFTCATGQINDQVWQPAAFSNSGSPLQGSIASLYTAIQLTCISGSGIPTDVTLRSGAPLKAERAGSAFSLATTSFAVGAGNLLASSGSFTVPWTNPTGVPGIAGLPGITFSSTPVASTLGGSVRLTGTIKAVSPSLTLS